MRRHEVSDATWEVVSPHLSGKASDCGVTAKDNRLFFNAVLWIARTGCPWADLPERFGKSNTACKRFGRLAKKGVWERLFATVQMPDLAWVMLDSTILRAHQHAAGQKKVTPKPNASAAVRVG
jgi:transposase